MFAFNWIWRIPPQTGLSIQREQCAASPPPSDPERDEESDFERRRGGEKTNERISLCLWEKKGKEGRKRKADVFGKGGKRGREEWGRMGNRWVSRAMIAGLILPNEYIHTFYVSNQT